MAPTINPAYRLRPLDLGDVLDEAFRIYRARFGLMFGTALVASIPAVVMGVGGGLTTLLFAGIGLTTGSAPTVRQGGFDTSLAWLVIAGIVLALAMFPVTESIPHFAACAAALGLPATPRTITVAALRNYFRLWVLALASSLMRWFWFLVITIYFLVNWSFTFQAVYLEHAGVGRAFRRSAELTRDGWWRIFGIRLLAYLITGVIGIVISSTASLTGLLLPAGLLRQGTSGVLTALATAVLVPYSALVVTLLYLDQRVRREHLDLQLMAGQAGWVEPVPAPPPVGAPAAGWSDLPPPRAG